MSLKGGEPPGPVPPPRLTLMSEEGKEAKKELVDSFVGFNAPTVSENHLRLAKNCIAKAPVRSARYVLVPFSSILTWNRKAATHNNTGSELTMISQAYDLLLKYVTNLLKPAKPPVWRSIKTTNSHFCARVDCMKGARKILEVIGYSVMGTSSMQFPDSVMEPDKDKLHIIAAELLMAKLEVNDTLRNPPPAPSSPSPVKRTQDNLQWSHNSHVTGVPHHVTTHPVNGSQPSLQPSLLPNPHHAEPQLYTGHGGPPTNAHTSGPSSSVSQAPSYGGSQGVSGTSGHASVTRPTANFRVPSPVEEEEDEDLRKIRERRLAVKNSIQSKGNTRSDITASNAPPREIPARDFHTTVQLVRNQPPTQPGRAPMSGARRPQPKAHLSFPMNKIDEEQSSLSMSGQDPTQPPPASSYQPPPSTTTPSTSSPHPPLSTSPAAPPTFCPKCQNKLSSRELRCTYCSSTSSPSPLTGPLGDQGVPNVAPPAAFNLMGLQGSPTMGRNIGPTQVGMPPGGAQNVPPLRASAASTQEAIDQYRRTRALGVLPGPLAPTGGNFQGVPSPRIPRAAPMKEKMRGEVEGGGGGWGGGAEGGRGEAGGRGGAEGVRGAEGGKGGEEKEDLDRILPTGQTYREYLADKERYRKKMRENEAQSPKSQALNQSKAPRGDRKPPRDRKATGERDVDDSTAEFENYKRQEKMRKKMMEIEAEGQNFLKCIKHCIQTAQNLQHPQYSLEEIELAYQKCKGHDNAHEAFKYLQNEWSRDVRETQETVWSMVDEYGRSVGYPSELEARRHLVVTNGDLGRATTALRLARKEKIEQLIDMFKPQQTLEWAAAIAALDRAGMDVERACCAIQCEALQPLYEFIFSDWRLVKSEDMKNIKELMKKEGQDQEVSLRLLMGEYKLESTGKAEMVLELMKEMEGGGEGDYPLSYYVEAAKDYSSFELAKKYLINPCPICFMEYPVHEMINMPGCTDSLCKDCFKGHFSVVIKEFTVKHFNCPQCDLPDMSNRDGTEDMYQFLFVQMIHEHLPDQYDLVQKKLTELNLQKDPGFRWCANEKCGECFLNPNPDRKKVQCPTCNELMCFQCKKPWEDQHEGLSCKEFASWKQENDPNFQKEGLAAHLQANGIDCPACHARYELARGGCMHFKCTRCPNEFCSGCGGSFKKAQACGRFQSCADKGLHAHHPRDCLFYMRDFMVQELQKFLRDNNVDFETDPSTQQLEAAKKKQEEGEEEENEEEGRGEAEAPAGGDKIELKCSAMLQKEVPPNGLVDEECGDTIKEGQAGLCEKHYKEYLVDKINSQKLDPLPMYETHQIELILKRDEKEVPEREDDEEDAAYRERLIEHVEQELPLQRGLVQEKL